jgi:hypothetical protein
MRVFVLRVIPWLCQRLQGGYQRALPAPHAARHTRGIQNRRPHPATIPASAPAVFDSLGAADSTLHRPECTLVLATSLAASQEATACP